LDILKKCACNVLGTPIRSIEIIEDRSLLTQEMAEIGEQVVPMETVDSLEKV
jgi:carbamoylphosphate synthase large subunit